MYPEPELPVVVTVPLPVEFVVPVPNPMLPIPGMVQPFCMPTFIVATIASTSMMRKMVLRATTLPETGSFFLAKVLSLVEK